MTKDITIKVPLEQISDQFIEQLDGLCEENIGEHKLKMKIVDESNDIAIDVKSDNKLINASFEFITALEDMGVKYKVGKK